MHGGQLSPRRPGTPATRHLGTHRDTCLPCRPRIPRPHAPLARLCQGHPRPEDLGTQRTLVPLQPSLRLARFSRPGHSNLKPFWHLQFKPPWPTQVNCPNVLVVHHLHLLNLRHVQKTRTVPPTWASPRESNLHCRRTMCLVNQRNCPPNLPQQLRGRWFFQLIAKLLFFFNSGSPPAGRGIATFARIHARQRPPSRVKGPNAAAKLP